MQVAGHPCAPSGGNHFGIHINYHDRAGFVVRLIADGRGTTAPASTVDCGMTPKNHASHPTGTSSACCQLTGNGFDAIVSAHGR
jgi:hypothetical protein